MGSRFESTFPCVRTTPRGSAVVPDVKTISRGSLRCRPLVSYGSGDRPLTISGRSSRTMAAIPVGCGISREITANRGAASAITRLANSGDAMASIGTTIAPRSRHPMNTASHSPVFGPKRNTRSPRVYAARFEFARKLRGNARKLRPRPPLHPVALPPRHGNLPRRTRIRAKILSQ